MSMSETWQKRVLILAAAWNLLGGAASLVDPAAHFAQMYHGALDLSDPLQRFFFTSVWIAVMAWGAAYLAAAFAPAARGAVMAAGGLGKVVYFGACLALYLEGAAKPALVMAAGLGDLGIASLFALALFGLARPQPEARPQAA
jgi:hypothetical protein